MEPESLFTVDSSPDGGSTPFETDSESSTPATSVENLPIATNDKVEQATQGYIPEETEATSPEPEVKETDPSTALDNDKETSKSAVKEPQKSRVRKVEQQGVYTFKRLEGTNFVKEWHKALKVSTPYVVRLFKLFWKLSPARVSVLIAVNVLKAALPSVTSWRVKQLLDEVQRVSLGQSPRMKRLTALAILGASHDWILYLLNVASYDLVTQRLIQG